MAASRFAGTPVIARMGRARRFASPGVLAALGVAAALALPSMPGILVGIALWGAGTALVFPAAMSAGGEQPGRAADAIAAVSTIGYGGFLIGPPLIGILAEQVGLGTALWILPALAVGVVVLAPVVAPPRPRTALEPTSRPRAAKRRAAVRRGRGGTALPGALAHDRVALACSPAGSSTS